MAFVIAAWSSDLIIVRRFNHDPFERSFNAGKCSNIYICTHHAVRTRLTRCLEGRFRWKWEEKWNQCEKPSNDASKTEEWWRNESAAKLKPTTVVSAEEESTPQANELSWEGACNLRADTKREAPGEGEAVGGERSEKESAKEVRVWIVYWHCFAFTCRHKKQQRTERRAFMARTKRGQPNFNKQIKCLLTKIQKRTTWFPVHLWSISAIFIMFFLWCSKCSHIRLGVTLFISVCRGNSSKDYDVNSKREFVVDPPLLDQLI